MVSDSTGLTPLECAILDTIDAPLSDKDTRRFISTKIRSTKQLIVFLCLLRIDQEGDRERVRVCDVTEHYNAMTGAELSHNQVNRHLARLRDIGLVKTKAVGGRGSGTRLASLAVRPEARLSMDDHLGCCTRTR